MLTELHQERPRCPAKPILKSLLIPVNENYLLLPETHYPQTPTNMDLVAFKITSLNVGRALRLPHIPNRFPFVPDPFPNGGMP
jgi:hypothetical protein